MKTIFPKEILDYTSELYRYNFRKKNHIVYVVLLITLIIVAIALPFIKIDLYSSSRGMIRPGKERNKVTSPIDGRIQNVYVSENSIVKKGDTLISLDNNLILQELKLAQVQRDSLDLFIHDLNLICKSEIIPLDSIKSFLYKSELIEYRQKLKGLEEGLERKLSSFQRQNHLYKKGVIARVEYEAASFELESTRNEVLYFRKRQKNLWQNQFQRKLSDSYRINSTLNSLKKNRALHYIIAPSSGNIQELKGLEKNNYLYTGSSIAEISPQTDLFVECYVSPSDIGLLKEDLPVKFQINAFDHRHWGKASGNIVRINKDISTINNVPMFKVLCSINESALFLNKKTKGSLKKGMTLTALFFIKNRSLFQLLFDKLEDWYDQS